MATTERVSPRLALRSWLREVTDDAHEISYTQLTVLAQQEFANDPEFALAAAQEFIAALIPEMLGELMRHRRRDMVSVHSGYVSGEKVSLSAMDRISRVLEGTGSGGYKSLIEHTKPELLALNERDELQVATTRKWIGFRGELAAKMTNTQIVGDLKPAFVEGTWARYFATD